jgi:hypothetical protein
VLSLKSKSHTLNCRHKNLRTTTVQFTVLSTTYLHISKIKSVRKGIPQKLRKGTVILNRVIKAVAQVLLDL